MKKELKETILAEDMKMLSVGTIIDLKCLNINEEYHNMRIIGQVNRQLILEGEIGRFSICFATYGKRWIALREKTKVPHVPCVRWIKEFQCPNEDYTLRVTFNANAPKIYTIEICSRWSDYLEVPYSKHIHTRKRLNEYLSSIHNGYRTLEEIWKEVQEWRKNNEM